MNREPHQLDRLTASIRDAARRGDTAPCITLLVRLHEQFGDRQYDRPSAFVDFLLRRMNPYHEVGCALSLYEKEKVIALSEAVKGGQAATVQAILGLGVDPTLGSVLALTHAASRGDIDIAKRLLTAGLDVNAGQQSRIPFTALETAALFGRQEMIRFLLEQGADCTADVLAIAAIKGNVPLVRFLLEHGVDVNAKLRRYNETIYDLVRRGRRIEHREKILRLIRRAGGKHSP